MLRYWKSGQFDILLMTFTILLFINFHTVNSSSDLSRSICSFYTIMGCVITQDFLFWHQIQRGPVVEGVNTTVGDLQELSKGLENCTLPVAAERINEARQNGTLQPLIVNYDVFNLLILLMSSTPFSFRVSFHPGQSLLKVASSHSVEKTNWELPQNVSSQRYNLIRVQQNC